MPPKLLDEVGKRVAYQTRRQLNAHVPFFLGNNIEKKMKLRSLEALTGKHFHSFALVDTKGLSELIFRRWLREDDAFMECCNIIRLSFVDTLEYAVLCRSGFFGGTSRAKYETVDTKGLCDFLRIARYHGVYRRLKGNGWSGKVKATGGVSREGEGQSCAIIEEGREGDLCTVPAADAVSQKP